MLRYIAINNWYDFLPKQLEDKGMTIVADIAQVLRDARTPWKTEITINEGLETKRRFRTCRARIDQADAVVIGGGSGSSSAAGYDHYHWSPALSEALPFREQYVTHLLLAGFYHCFSNHGEQWGYYS